MYWHGGLGHGPASGYQARGFAFRSLSLEAAGQLAWPSVLLQLANHSARAPGGGWQAGGREVIPCFANLGINAAKPKPPSATPTQLADTTTTAEYKLA